MGPHATWLRTSSGEGGSPSLPLPASTREMRDGKGVMGIRVSVFFHMLFLFEVARTWTVDLHPMTKIASDEDGPARCDGSLLYFLGYLMWVFLLFSMAKC